MSEPAIRYIGTEEIARRLTYEVCIPLVRDAMIAFSRGETLQTLRAIIPLADGRAFGVMPGAMGERAPFGAKILSVYPDNFAKRVQSHQGVVLLFDPDSGAPVCILHAGEITAIRTAAASAVATDALARKDASRLAILGYGEQAATHARAIAKVRHLTAITVWGRSAERAGAFADRMTAELGIPVTAASDARTCVAEADMICTVTAARAPILLGAWVKPGTHVNLVGSSIPGPVEVDDDFVAGSRFFVDSREGVMRQGAEFLHAKAAGLIGDDHILGEIGQVLAGDVEGRISDGDVTAYKSLGHVVQDLATGWWLYSDAGTLDD
jgi:ornithine cyclodeaminase/alanine dehydrogenase-like protein (mu-crystallin family)